ncbi:hypothetical protein Taro_028288 [Colocasia esculenta]|uniref:Aminotransferase-like plant mobile domain-containing protein n=1 Tax=Colocasia esculenta TaxID=4460 RepID=A0A843VTR5_COLES|nr:hypothetical protein [Colocasia esculenta]
MDSARSSSPQVCARIDETALLSAPPPSAAASLLYDLAGAELRNSPSRSTNTRFPLLRSEELAVLISQARSESLLRCFDLVGFSFFFLVEEGSCSNGCRPDLLSAPQEEAPVQLTRTSGDWSEDKVWSDAWMNKSPQERFHDLYEKTRFWCDAWMNNKSPQDRFRDLYAITSATEVKISGGWSYAGITSQWQVQKGTPRFLPARENGGWNPHDLSDSTYLTAYLMYWLAIFVVPLGDEDVIRPELIYSVHLLAEGHMLSIAPAVLSCLYHHLGALTTHGAPRDRVLCVATHYLSAWAGLLLSGL